MKTNSADSRMLSAFFHDVSIMIASGTDMEDIATTMESDCQQEQFHSMLVSLRTSIGEGDSLSTAMTKTGCFPDYAVHMIQAAEAAGRMEEVTQALGRYYDRQDHMRQVLRAALVQPLILLSLLTVILGGFVAFILPVLSGVYDALGGDASMYISGAYIIGGIAFAVTALALLAVLICWICFKTGTGGATLTALWQGSRLTKKTALIFAQAFFAADIEVRLSGGLLPDMSFERAALNVTNSAFKSAAVRCAERLDQGESMGLVLLEERLFPPVCTHILYGSSLSGDTERGFRRVRELLFNDAEERSELLIKGIEPILTGFFTLAVGLSLISIMLPLIGIISAMG